MREPLFVIAPPRSYTSVIGGILGQHPQTYGLPEVNLSHGETLGDMWDAVPIAANNSTSGLLRLLAELHEGTQSEAAVVRARAWVMKRPHWTGARVFAHIQEALGDRVMVEKSPRNTVKIDNLRRLHQMFPDGRFLHLTRHPRSQGKSVIEILKDYGDENPQVDPAQGWLRMQSNILQFSRDLRPGQYMRIKGEALLGNPRLYLKQICEWLGIDDSDAAIEAMLHPETSPFACMGPPSAPFGNDPNFLTRPKLDYDRLARIQEPPLTGEVDWTPGAEFSRPVQRLARQFGYA